MVEITRLLLISALVLSLLVPGAAHAAGKTLYVDDSGGASNSTARGRACGRPNYEAIQGAVNAAASGDRIVVCRGTYTEIVTVDGRSLRIEARAGVTLKAAAVFDARAVVAFTGEQTSSLTGFTITNVENRGDIRIGVLVSRGADVRIARNRIRDIIQDLGEDPPLLVGNAVSVFGEEATPGDTRAVIEHNRLERYGGTGIFVGSAYAMIDDNRIIGRGASFEDNQYGIELSFGASVDAEDNHITRNDGGNEDDVSAAVIMQGDTGAVSIRDTIMRNGRYGFYSAFAGDFTLRSNEISGNEIDGIPLQETNGALITENRSDDNGRDGIRATVGSAENTIRGNRMDGNDEHDAHDDGTPPPTNTWTGNDCDTENRSGLCG